MSPGTFPPRKPDSEVHTYGISQSEGKKIDSGTPGSSPTLGVHNRGGGIARRIYFPQAESSVPTFSMMLLTLLLLVGVDVPRTFASTTRPGGCLPRLGGGHDYGYIKCVFELKLFPMCTHNICFWRMLTQL